MRSLPVIEIFYVKAVFNDDGNTINLTHRQRSTGKKITTIMNLQIRKLISEITQMKKCKCAINLVKTVLGVRLQYFVSLDGVKPKSRVHYQKTWSKFKCFSNNGFYEKMPFEDKFMNFQQAKHCSIVCMFVTFDLE